MDPRQLASLAAAEVRRLTGRMQRADAEDVVQEAMLRFCRYSQSNPVENPQRLFRRIVRHLIISRHRSTRTASGQMCVVLADDVFFQIVDGAPRADEVVIARQAIDAAMRVLMDLPERERTVYLAHALDGRTMRELAKEYEKPQSTMADKVAAVRNKLRAVAMKHGHHMGA